MIKLPDSLISKAAKIEGADAALIKKDVAAGYTVIPWNRKRDLARPCAIGRGLTTKVNTNLGMSVGVSGIDNELRKMDAALVLGTDAVMDLSLGRNLSALRRRILKECPVPLGTVPIYELACDKQKGFNSLREDDFLEVVRGQAEEGVDFFTIHSGITLKAVTEMRKKRRVLNIVSRGGALLASWMLANKKENPFLSRFDEVINICGEFGVTLSLGDSLRPGSIFDASDDFQIGELKILGKQQKEAHKNGVQVIIEGPGHVPLDQIEDNVRLEKKLCNGAPYYVLGPLVTDAAPGYDHIVSAIGGAVAAASGADFLCYVTPAEHIKLPDINDVKNGVVASKIAAHAADIVKKIPSALERDLAISKARAKRDWASQFELALDPEKPAAMRRSSQPSTEDICTMCGEFCSIKVTEKSFAEKSSGRKR